MDSEIEETHRQLRRSAALIQDAFEGLSTLHNRVSEASSIRAQSGSSASPLPPAPVPRHLTTVERAEDRSSRSTMDPGHDLIVISSDSDSTPIPSTSASPPSLSPPASTSPRRPGRRPSDPTLASLRTELVASTQSVRDRAMELDDLRRSISQYSQERNALQAEGASPPGTETTSRAQESNPASHPVFRRRVRLELALRQRAAAESATSLGRMVAARSTSPPSTSGALFLGTNAPSTVFTTTSSATTVASARTPAPIPSGISSRVTRLAQEIQQDIARITQQSESLMEWINDHRVRLDAAAAARASGSASSDVTTGRAYSTIRTSPSQSALPIAPPAEPNPTELVPPAGLSVSAVSRPLVPPESETIGAREETRRLREQSNEGSTNTPAIPVRPRRSPDGAVRARYLRQSFPAGFNATSPSSSPRSEEFSSSWRSPGSFSARVIAPPSMSPSTTITADAATSMGSVYREPDFIEATNRVHAALARARSLRRTVEYANSEQNPSHVVRRRLNADGEEEFPNFPIGLDALPAFREVTERARQVMEEPLDEDEEDAEDAWLQALSRLDAMSRQTAARDAASRSTTNPPSSSRWEPPPMTRGGTRLGTSTSRTVSASPYTINLPQRDTRRWRDDPLLSDEAESEYERDLAAMRARARSLISPVAARTFGSTTLPPPPPADTVRRTLTPTSNTQGTGTPGLVGSLWSDPSTSSPALRYQDLFRQYEPGRSSHTRGSVSMMSSPSPPPERARRDRTENGTRADADLERPMWGSPTPFYPSPLPLPLVEDVGSLEMRSRAFGAPKVLVRIPRRGIAQAGC